MRLGKNALLRGGNRLQRRRDGGDRQLLTAGHLAGDVLEIAITPKVEIDADEASAQSDLVQTDLVGLGASLGGDFSAAELDRGSPVSDVVASEGGGRGSQDGSD
jgi:hypothetical protein